MKLSASLFLTAFAGNAHVALCDLTGNVNDTWEPPRLDYRDLLQSVQKIGSPDSRETGSITDSVESVIGDALLNGAGVLSLTNVISQSEKDDLYDAMVACHSSTDSAREVIYSDGTKRSTWAASSSGDLNACDKLNTVADPIRKQVGEVTNNLALQIEDALNHLGHIVVFPKASVEDLRQGYSLSELTSHGEQLDHFHVYNGKSSSGGHAAKTIDWHTDYGFALAFLPGQVLTEDDSFSKYTPTQGFFIQLPDGSTKEVSFTQEDDVVILLGDGVHHINNAIGDNADIKFRAVPHSFIMPGKEDDLRMWYGRMLLFPLDMVHSTLDKAFGDVKEAMNSDPTYHLNSNSGFALGCSSPEALSPRLLADENVTCDDDQFMCWHACFNHTEDISPAACESRDLELACVSNVDGSIWDGEVHGKEYEPACILADDELDETDSAVTNSPTVTPTSSSAMIGFLLVPIAVILNTFIV